MTVNLYLNVKHVTLCVKEGSKNRKVGVSGAQPEEAFTELFEELTGIEA